VNKPLLLLITGRPGSGKSTLAGLLSERLRCPLVSRDRLKEGYIYTAQSSHNTLPQNTNKEVSGTFFRVLELLAGAGVSVVAEAAFQQRVWQEGLRPVEDKARIMVLLCSVNPNLAIKRFNDRLLADPEREKLHGDRDAGRDEPLKNFILEYTPPALPVPVLEVDTTDGYLPNLDAIIDFITG